MITNNKRGKKTKPDVINEIISIKRGDPENKLTAKDIGKLLKRYHTQIPHERAIYNIIKKNKDKITFNELDSPWSLGSHNCDIPENRINEILAIQGVLSKDDRYLTVRCVKWIIKLAPFIKTILDDKFPGEFVENAIRLFEIATIYNRREQESEINKNPYLNTHDLDKRFIIDRDISFNSYLDEWVKIFLSDIFEQEKHLAKSERMNPAEFEKMLSRFEKQQTQLFFQWLNLLISNGDIKAFINDHPGIEPLVNRWLIMSTRRDLAKLFAYVRENKTEKVGV